MREEQYRSLQEEMNRKAELKREAQAKHAQQLKKQIEERERIRQLEMTEFEKQINKSVLDEISEMKMQNTTPLSNLPI